MFLRKIVPQEPQKLSWGTSRQPSTSLELSHSKSIPCQPIKHDSCLALPKTHNFKQNYITTSWLKKKKEEEYLTLSARTLISYASTYRASKAQADADSQFRNSWMKALHSIQNLIDQYHSPKPKRNLSDCEWKGFWGGNLLGRFFEGLVGIDEVSKSVILQRAK